MTRVRLRHPVLPTLDVLDVGWMELAACLPSNDPGHWGDDWPLQWDTDSPYWPEGRRICLGCPVKDECLDWIQAVESGPSRCRSNIYAGLTPDQRADLAGNHSRKPLFARCHTCNARMSPAHDRPSRVRKQATEQECMSCWSVARNPDPRRREITEAEAKAAHNRWVQGFTDAVTRRGETAYQRIRKREHRRLAREDAQIWRCSCGAWRYAEQGCGACGEPVMVESADARIVNIPRRFSTFATTDLDGRIAPNKCSPTAQTMGLRPLTRSDRGAAL